MLFSGVTSIIVVLAIPFGFRAIYISTNLQFMTLLYLQIEIVLDAMIIAEVLYNIVFSSNVASKDQDNYDEEEKGIKDILSNQNLERLQKEIFQAYEKNDLLKFNPDKSGVKESSPRNTDTENSEPVKRYKLDDDDRNSFYPISELDGEKNMSFEFSASFKNDLSKRTNRMEWAQNRGISYNEESMSKLEKPAHNVLTKIQSEQRTSEKPLNRKHSHKSNNYEGLKLSKQLLEDIQNSKIQGIYIYLYA